MRALVTPDEMRRAEADAAARGLSLPALMQMAAHGASKALLELQRPGGNRYLILAGPGNNGGDALVVAGLLRDAGALVQIITYRRNRPSDIDPEGIPRTDMADDPSGQHLRSTLDWCDVAVDGILGIGRARPIEPDLAHVLTAVNSADRRPYVVALDMPTGIDADTGRADPATLRADETLTFGYVKRGLLLYPARSFCGSITLVDIGLPQLPRVPVSTWQPDGSDIARWLPERSATVHKFSAGAVLALAGSPHFVGAPILSTSGALRAGAGYVTLAGQQETLAILATRLLEVTMLTLPSDRADAVKRLNDVASRYSALLVGPGLGRSDGTTHLVMDVLSGAVTGPQNALVDADALFALSATPDWWKKVTLPLVLTPHTGEMARLTGLDAHAIENDRLSVVESYARTWQQVVALKGAPTIVATP
ncbi:MAG: epimerase / dehydratase, partial [Chloroflexi bacterium]|nr:epimerase / dehydratase [Chloroflexota bacterium]